MGYSDKGKRMSRSVRSPSNTDDDMVIISLGNAFDDTFQQNYQHIDDDEDVFIKTRPSQYQRIRHKLGRFWSTNPRFSTFLLTFGFMSVVILSIILANAHPRKVETHDKPSLSSAGITIDYSLFHTISTKAAVASDVGVCSDMGLSILKQGGNAVDASVTVALCLGIMSPGKHLLECLSHC